jgi:hypothetical protein
MWVPQTFPEYLMDGGGELIYTFVLGFVLLANMFYLSKQARDFRTYLRTRSMRATDSNPLKVSVLHGQVMTVTTGQQ